MLIFERYSDQAGYGLHVPGFGVRFTAGSRHFPFPPCATDCEDYTRTGMLLEIRCEGREWYRLA
jgi:hypothetical protein